MKKFFFMVVAMVAAFGANAQVTVGRYNSDPRINLDNAEQCRKYFQFYPQDTLVRVTKVEGTMKTDKKVIRRRVYQEGGQLIAITDTVVWERIGKGEILADSVAEAVCMGKTYIYNDHHTDARGRDRHKVTIGASAGLGSFKQTGVTPIYSLSLGYEACHWFIDLEADLLFNRYSATAETANAKYASFSMTLNPAYKIWQDKRYRHYVALGGKVGYGYSSTDGGQIGSANYGFVFGGFAKGAYAVDRSGRFKLTAEIGYTLYPFLSHDVSIRGNEMQENSQSMANHGLYGKVGVSYSF